MPLTRGQAKEICTKPEYELVEASFRPAVTELTTARLRSKITRARRLEDKYRDLARSQNRQTKLTRSGPARRPTNRRTERKARLFGETRERFEKRLTQLESKEGAGAGASPGRAARRTASRKAAGSRRKERRQARRDLR